MWNHTLINRIVLGFTLCGILAGIVARLAGQPRLAALAWAATTLAALVPLTVTIVRTLLAGKAGVDIIALLAMAGALALHQYLAGAVIALMLSGGEALEDFAGSRARRELSALLERAPRIVHRYEGEDLTSPDIEDVRPGDLLLVKPGEVVPVDGVVVGETAVLDEAALTGESRPVDRLEGDQVRSGTVNAARTPFRMRAIATARRSTYAGIIRLVEEAQASKAPMVRLADRYSMLFLPLTLIVAGSAWFLSGDPVRALAVLVVATPCPLILAVPVAIVSGISRAARHGIIVKGGGALETLARGRILVLDKTGTVTGGESVLKEVESFGSIEPDEILRLAASLDQISPHIIASVIVRSARERNLPLSFPEESHEDLGSGVRGLVDGRRVEVGRIEWIAPSRRDLPRVRSVKKRTAIEGSTAVFVSVEGALAGALVLEDPIRADAPFTIRSLHRCGFSKIVMLTGDHRDLAETVGSAIGVDTVLAERTPEEKVEAVRAVLPDGVTVMVGDGINDAPALAAADVGVAMGARGATASSEAADIVIIVDRLDRLIDGVRVSRRSRGIALQSVLVGMGLSVGAMFVAAAGYLVPVAGALFQEVIDVIVILNALRALRDQRAPAGLGDVRRVAEVGQHFREEHRKLLPQVDRIRQVADRLDEMAPESALVELEGVRSFLVDELIPHEEAEDAAVYPVVAQIIGGEDPTATMSRAHLEISHLIRIYCSLLDHLPSEGPGTEDLREIRRILYGLHAILRLHFAQEEESYLALIDERVAPQSA